MQSTQRASGFGEELVGVAALVVLGVLMLALFAASPPAAVVTAMLGAVAVWDRSSRASRTRIDGVITVRRFAYCLALVGIGFLLFV